MKVGNRVEIIEGDSLVESGTTGTILKTDSREWKPMSDVRLDASRKDWPNIHGWFYNSNLKIIE